MKAEQMGANLLFGPLPGTWDSFPSLQARAPGRAVCTCLCCPQVMLLLAVSIAVGLELLTGHTL